jgi:hypothetical protein
MVYMNTNDLNEIYRTKVNLETSQIAWKELQGHFARGVVLHISTDLDLVEVAFQMSKDNAVQIQQWMISGGVSKVSDAQAADWYAADLLLWAVVVSPWVLVQAPRQVH